MALFMTNTYNYIVTNLWLFKILGVIVLAFSILWIESSIYHKIEPKLAKTRLIWDDVLLQAAHKPFSYLVGSIAVTAVLSIIARYFSLVAASNSFFSYTYKIIIIAYIFYFAMSYINLLQANYTKQLDRGMHKHSKTSVNAISQLFRLFIIISFVVIATQVLGIPVSNFVAFGSVATTLILGVAAKDSLSNFFGGIVIYCDRPFEIGHWIKVREKQIEGTVEHIGWRMTRIRTFDKRPLYVPNSVFMMESVENPSRMSHRRIKTLIGVRYEDASKLEVILAEIHDMISHHASIDNKQTILINFTEFAESSLNILIYCFTKTTNWNKYLEVKQDVYLNIIAIIKKHGADCAFPTRTLQVAEGVNLQNITKGDTND